MKAIDPQRKKGRYFRILIYALFIILTLAITVITPVALQYCIIENDFPSKASNDGWASFFGSYLGGVFGGIATLVAVILTIHFNQKEQERRSNEEKRERIRKSVIIIYNDFEFSFNNIRDFLFFYWKNKNNRCITNKLEEEDKETFLLNRKRLNQFYFDNNWICTVAELNDSCQFTSDDIKRIYEVYGHLMTINKILNSDDYYICQSAYKAMNSIMNWTMSLNTLGPPDYYVKKPIDDLMKKFKEIIDDNKPWCQAPTWSKKRQI